jgi:YD repeat-containing protein
LLALRVDQTSLLSDNNNNWSLSYEYNDDGSLKKRADARGVETSYAYDELGRVNTRSYSDTTPVGRLNGVNKDLRIRVYR